MKTFIISEEKLKKNILKESYGDKAVLIKNFLDANFMRATFTKNGDDGLKKNIGIFVQLDSNKLPTDTQLTADSVFDIVQNKFNKIISDKTERNRFIIRVIKDWYNNEKGLKDGTLSVYDF
jgi:hypothetical protein